MLLEGFKFGMLLQIAIGPVCMYIFSLGTTQSFLMAVSGVLGVVLADGIYIILALFGISSFIKNKSIQRKFNILGAAIVLLFGMELFFSYFGVSILPKISIFGNFSSDFPFLKAFLLTAANPMTILFWIGIFSTKINQEDFSNKNTLFFSTGTLLATLIFLTFVAFTGTLTSHFLPDNFMKILNAAVGGILICFGIKKFIKKG